MPKATPSPNPNPSDPGVKWGILATGTIAQKFVADVQATQAGRVVACGSRTIEGARTFAQTHSIPKAYGSYGELARDPEVEAIYIATPHTLHFETALACLRNKKAVLCEKPLAINADQASRLFEAAEEHGAYLMEGLWTMFLPAFVQARRWFQEGAIGELRLIEADFGFSAPDPGHGRLFAPELGGGALLDVGVYTVALAQAFGGLKTPHIKATGRKTPTGVDETTALLLDWNSGVRAHLSCSIAHPLDNTARIHGTKGTITLPEFWRATEATLETPSGKTVFEDRRTTHGYDFEARAMAEDLRANRRENASLPRAFSLRLMSTLDAARKQIGVKYPSEV